MTELSRSILAKGLGEYILKYLEETPYREEDLVEGGIRPDPGADPGYPQ